MYYAYRFTNRRVKERNIMDMKEGMSMGLDAYVECNCVKEGKVKPPPFDIGLLEWTNEGINLPESVDDATFSLFLNWREDACKHENFHYYYNRVANGAGGNFFWGAMERLGEGDFPLLQSIGGAPIYADQAEKALTELDILELRVQELEGIFLLEFESMEQYQKALPSENRWFYSSGGQFTYRLDERGFCIEDRDNRELFRSMAFTQEVIRTESDGREQQLVQFEDCATGFIHMSTHPFSKKTWGVEELYYPNFMQVIIRNLKGVDFPAIRVLRRLFEASIKTGNPVIWS